MCDNSFTITLLMFHGGPKHILQNCQNKALSVMEHVCILSAFHDTGADLGGGCRGCAPLPDWYNWYSAKKNYVVYWC